MYTKFQRYGFFHYQILDAYFGLKRRDYFAIGRNAPPAFKLVFHSSKV